MDSSSRSVNRRIFKAAVVIAAVTVLVKFAALGKEMLIAWRFGTGDGLDALQRNYELREVFNAVRYKARH